MAELPAQDITSPQKQGIMDQTLGEILKGNPQAQNVVMQSMQLSPEKFQEMVNTADTNPMMHMKISDLLKNGFVQQAVSQQGQMTPEQAQILQNVTQTSEAVQTPQKVSFLEKVRNWLIK